MTINNIIIIGGGIAGLTCAESYSHLKPNDKVTILSCSPILKTVCNVQKISKVLESFDVFETRFTDVEFKNSNISVTICEVESIDVDNRMVKTDKGDYHYDYLSICAGAKPNLIKKSPYIIGIRDTETIVDLKNRLNNAKRIIIIGNGGIALELIHEIKGCEIIWSIKDKHIGNAFFDREAADFLFRSKQEIDKNNNDNQQQQQQQDGNTDELVAENKNISTLSNSSLYRNESGSALGPQWYSKYNFSDGNKSTSTSTPTKYKFNENVNIQYSTMLEEIYESQDDITKYGKWPVYAKLNNGEIFGCDFIISATGVIPNSSILKNTNIKLTDDDGSVIVDENMKTNIDRIYAAGDICNLKWKSHQQQQDSDENIVWFQMKLWSQARTQGRYAAQCMANQTVLNTLDEHNLHEICTSFEFELFAHATKFFGFKVIMLGIYNGQFISNLSDESIYKVYTREIIGEQYVKVIIKNGKLIGALLIGDTDLEETFENLILNKIDLSIYGSEILNPDIDLEDYFD